MDWLFFAIRTATMFILSSALWYVWRVRKLNLRRNPEIVEEANKKRIASGKPPLIAEEMRCLLRRQMALQSLLFGFFATIGLTLGYILVDWAATRFFG